MANYSTCTRPVVPSLVSTKMKQGMLLFKLPFV